ncbi:hypothetical protein K9L27_04200 [Candidatus Gracilibacteria bacterium]|nr:hypothetical protein [Candidatus Gracilibacteria bacterium]
MKKAFLLTLAFGIGMSLISTAEAFKEDPNESPFSFSNKRSVQQKLNDAIWLRYRNMNSTLERDGIQKNRLYQEAVHKLSMKENNTNEQPNTLSRDGELQFVPYYGDLQEYSNSSMIRKNAKQIFRKRAIDYYVDGGDAGTAALRSDVVLGSQNKVNRMGVLNTIWKQDIESIDSLRAIQKQLYSPPLLGSGQQRSRAINKADRSKEFMHPFMPADYLE